MDNLRLGFTDTFEGAKNYFTHLLSKRYNVIRDDQKPDYLIFGDRNFGENNLIYNDCVRIFYTGENQRPEFYNCDYAITFDHPYNHKMFRLPLYIIYEFDHQIFKNRRLRLKTDDLFLKKADNNFCSFIVKNPGCQYRNEYFHTLSQFFPVASAGPLFNSLNGWTPRDVKEKVLFMSDFAFNLCFENSSYPGYCTEKLFEALCAKTIPIYWGSSTVGLDFNTKAFLNRYDFNSDEQFIKEIISIYKDEKEYNHIYMQPMFSSSHKSFEEVEINFLEWFGHNVYKGEKK